uniref:CSON003559 protein n=1 Tax=Culicoides sonorensis TaxID=179676 RepID=A0A336L1P1_CULSO
MYHSPNWPDLSQPESVFEFIQTVYNTPHNFEKGPIAVVDRFGGAHACTFCIISTIAMELEYDNTANIFMHAKLYHNKRPGIWMSIEDIRHIYSIAYYCPNNLNLLNATSLRTEFDDIAVATPDLFSKICSNGSTSRVEKLNNLVNEEITDSKHIHETDLTVIDDTSQQH